MTRSRLESGGESISRSGERRSRLLPTVLVVVLAGLAVVVVPRAYVGYHEWRLERAGQHFVANTSDGEAIEQMEYHRDRLVDAGVYRRLRYEFRHVPADSAHARKVVGLSTSAASPPHVDLISPAGKRGQPLVITVTCTPANVAAWESFFTAQDVP